jgi:thiol-disulfide isomerase/thioredoxin
MLYHISSINAMFMKITKKYITAILLGLCVSSGYSSHKAIAVVPPASESVAGKSAPAFIIKTLDGKVLNSSQLAGKPYIVNFFASWCPPCRQELPGMVELQKKYAEKGFTFVGVAFRDREATLPDFLWEMGVEYPVALTNPELEAAFGRFLPGGKIRAIPASVVVGRDGKLLNVVSGALTKDDFESLILKALATRPAQ